MKKCVVCLLVVLFSCFAGFAVGTSAAKDPVVSESRLLSTQDAYPVRNDC